jgi:hypothetical protein
MFKSLCSGLLLGASALFSAHSAAAIISFDPLDGNNGDVYYGHQEAGFTIAPGHNSGSWGEGHLIGNGVPSIFSQSGTSSVNIYHTQGSAFTFNSVMVSCFDNPNLDGSSCGVEISGKVGGEYGVDVFPDFNIELPAQLADTTDPDFVPLFTTIANLGYSSAYIDFLTISITGNGVFSYNIDNIDVDVAGPGLFGLLAIGALGLTRGRRRINW